MTAFGQDRIPWDGLRTRTPKGARPPDTDRLPMVRTSPHPGSSQIRKGDLSTTPSCLRKVMLSGKFSRLGDRIVPTWLHDGY